MASDDDKYVCVPATKSFYRQHWLLLHLLCYVLIAVTSFAMLFHFPHLTTRFEGNCPLYAVPVVTKKFNVYRFVLEKSGEKATVWGGGKTCDFVFSVSGLSFIFAFIWCWFFCYCSVGDKWDQSMVVRDEKWRVVLPAMVFALLMTILTFVNSGVVSSGMYSFCKALDDSIVESCSKASDSDWYLFSNLKGFYTDAGWSISEAWVSCCGWLAQTVLLFVHTLEGPENRYNRKRLSITKRRRSRTPP